MPVCRELPLRGVALRWPVLDGSWPEHRATARLWHAGLCEAPKHWRFGFGTPMFVRSSMRRCASTTPALGRSSSRCPPKDRAEVSSPTSGRSVGGLSSPFELVLFDKFSSRMLTRVIDPDTKDWMWVLERACPECGFDASKCGAEDVAGLIRDNAQVWERFRRNGTIRPGRPNESTWSTLEYACHVRDVYRIYRTRIERMLTEDDPLFEYWDQDAAAIAHSYEQ